jgi:hypothetical protein
MRIDENENLNLDLDYLSSHFMIKLLFAIVNNQEMIHVSAIQQFILWLNRLSC